MTKLRGEDRRIQHIRRIIAREFGNLLSSCGPAPGGIGATRHQIKMAETRIRRALTDEPEAKR